MGNGDGCTTMWKYLMPLSRTLKNGYDKKESGKWLWWYVYVICILSQFFFFLEWDFIYFWLCWVFVSVRGLSLVVASGGHSLSRCAGLSLSRPLLLRNTGYSRAGSVVVAHGPSCSAACGIFPDQGSNLCPLHWQADSQPLHHQGSPPQFFKKPFEPQTTIWESLDCIDGNWSHDLT